MISSLLISTAVVNLIVAVVVIVLVVVASLLITRHFKRQPVTENTNKVPLSHKLGKHRKKIIISLVAVVLVVAMIIGVVVYNNNKWKYDFTLTYIEYVSDRNSANGKAYKLWELENNTNDTKKQVTLIIEIGNLLGVQEVTTTKSVGTMQPHETKEIKIYSYVLNEAIEEAGYTPNLYSYEITKITYK